MLKRRDFIIGGTAFGATLLANDVLPSRGLFVFSTSDGKRRILRELSEDGVAHAQYKVVPMCNVFGQCVWWTVYDPNQYATFMQQQMQSNPWLQGYQQQFGSMLNNYAADGYRLSQPNVMDHIRSIYSNGQSQFGKLALFGLNELGRRIRINEPLVASAASVVYDLAKDLFGEDDDDAPQSQRAAGPQDRHQSDTIADDEGNTTDTFSYPTKFGRAHVSKRRLRDEDTGDTGHFVVYDTRTGRQRSLVELDG